LSLWMSKYPWTKRLTDELCEIIFWADWLSPGKVKKFDYFTMVRHRTLGKSNQFLNVTTRICFLAICETGLGVLRRSPGWVDFIFYEKRSKDSSYSKTKKIRQQTDWETAIRLESLPNTLWLKFPEQIWDLDSRRTEMIRFRKMWKIHDCASRSESGAVSFPLAANPTQQLWITWMSCVQFLAMFRSFRQRTVL
jgi:hypothetical protein